jgi:sugar phosphate isomerase/epimerase
MATYVSTGAFHARSLPAIIDEAEALGLSHLELSSGCDPLPHFETFIPRLIESSLSFCIHNYFPAPAEPFVLNLGSLDVDVLDRSRKHVARSLELTAMLGGNYYSVHSAFALELTPDLLGRATAQSRAARRTGLLDRNAVRETFVASLQLLSEEAARSGLWLLVENNVLSARYYRAERNNPYLMVTADEIVSVLAEAGAPNLGLLLDVAHVRVSARALGFNCAEFMERVGPWTRAFHISENDGLEDQNHAVTAESWFWPYLAAFADRDVVLEVYGLNQSEILSQCALIHRKLGNQGYPPCGVSPIT